MYFIFQTEDQEVIKKPKLFYKKKKNRRKTQRPKTDQNNVSSNDSYIMTLGEQELIHQIWRNKYMKTMKNDKKNDDLI